MGSKSLIWTWDRFGVMPSVLANFFTKENGTFFEAPSSSITKYVFESTAAILPKVPSVNSTLAPTLNVFAVE